MSTSQRRDPPVVSVVVSTRNRPEQMVGCARSILGAGGPASELLVVDQSDDEATTQALAALGDPRIRVLRGSTLGVSAGRNQGILAAEGAIIAFTDDDCRVDPGWLSALVQRFADEPDTQAVCGRVLAPDGLAADEFVAEFPADVPELHPGFSRGTQDIGIGANFALRRSALDRIGPFDEAMGAGTAFFAGEETDLLLRALGAGLKVRNAPEASVLHLGVRRGAAVRKLRLGYVFGTAVAVLKNARAGNRAALRLHLRIVRRMAADVLTAALTGRRPLGVFWLLANLGGALATFRYGVDRRRVLLVGWISRQPVRARLNPAVGRRLGRGAR